MWGDSCRQGDACRVYGGMLEVLLVLLADNEKLSMIFSGLIWLRENCLRYVSQLLMIPNS